ncbi:MAG: hypothetical protein ACR2IE_19285 [Candidatus Sumerlaeaceae bacterium]
MKASDGSGAEPEISGADHYQMAGGSGVAAVLLFLHIALIGYLGFAGYYVLRSWRTNLVAAPAMSWQFYFPAALAALSYFPTDGLTRTLAVIARTVGIVALVLPLGVVAAHAAAAEGAVSLLWACIKLVLLGGAAGVLAAEWFRVGLTTLDANRRRTILPFAILKRSAAATGLAFTWMVWMLLLAGPAFRFGILTWAMVLGAVVIVSARIQRDFS